MSEENKISFRLLAHAIFLRNAAPLFFLWSLVAYMYTPSYKMNWLGSLLFAGIFLIPTHKYVTVEVGCISEHHINVKNAPIPSTWLIAKKVAIATSFMASIVAITSLSLGQASPTITNFSKQVIPSVVQTSCKAVASTIDGIFMTNANPSLSSLMLMCTGWTVSYVGHFVGLGIIPNYLNKWWQSIKKTAIALEQREKEENHKN